MKPDYSPNFDTVVDALSWLYSQGFDFDFRRNIGLTNTILSAGNDFVADYIFRFEGQTDPADAHIIYAISSNRHHVKGVVLSAFGVYADLDAFELVGRLLPTTTNPYIA